MMNVEQKRFSRRAGWEIIKKGISSPQSFHLVLAFGSHDLLKDGLLYQTIRTDYPEADILLCSTAGEITGFEVSDETISLTAIHMERTVIATAAVHVSNFENSFEAGYELASQLPAPNLKSVLLIADGQHVNGSDLILAMNEFLPDGTIITGGLAGDGDRFYSTLVGLNEAPIEGCIVAVGFYGEHIRVASGSMGGWDPFGVERLITRSEKNILFELDGKPALDIYKLYLGEYAAELPGSGLLFPLSIRTDGVGHPLVRTILSVCENEKSLTFAGDMPEGAYAQLMKANLDRLIDGAALAAEASTQSARNPPELAILISCVGRKLVLGQRVEEEVEIVRSVIGERTVLAGFYSYGEFAPTSTSATCELHNQTMTITTISEE